MPSMDSCPTPEKLLALQLGELDELTSEELFQHAENCPSCLSNLEKLDGVSDSVIQVLQQKSLYQDNRALESSREVPPSGEMPRSLGRYQILEETGRGGMGVVYLAWDTSLKRKVAIKMVVSGKYGGKQEEQRFLKESEVVARLQHPNIVQIYEVGQHQQLPFLVLEWIEGGTLSHYLWSHKLAARDAAALIEQLARGLHYAHTLGIVHRDVKPSNILLATRSGASSISSAMLSVNQTAEQRARISQADLPISEFIPKITDFGLAKLVDDNTALTQTGQVMGTPSYLSPEQARGNKQIGPATDIYGLGAILYELLSGQPPHVASTSMETVLKVIQEEIKPLSQIGKPIPPDLATICHKCLMRDPGNRYASALDLSNDLQRFLRGEPISARPVTSWERLWFWSQRKPALAATILIALLFLLVGSVVSLFFAINANFHAEEATKQAQRADAASRQAMEERKLAHAQSASLLFNQAMTLAEGGKIDQAIPSMLRAWKLVPEEDTAFQNAIRLNIDAWLQYVPRVLWQHDLHDERVLCFINGGDELLTWKDGFFLRRDTYTGKLNERVKLDAINEPLNITSVPDENRFALIDAKAVPGLRIGYLFDAKTLRPLGKPITMMKEGRKYGFCRIHFLDDPDLVVVRSELLDVPMNKRSILQAFHIKDGTPAGPEIIGSILGVLEPLKSADGTWLVLEGDADGNHRCRTLLTGKEMSQETVMQYPSIHSPARNIVHLSAASLMGGQLYLQNGKYRPWSPRSFNKHPNGVIGLAFESNKTLRFYDLADQQPYMTTITSLPSAQSSLMNPSNPTLALCNSNLIRMYDEARMLHSPEVIKNQAIKLESPFSSASLSPDQKSLILIQQRQNSTRAFLMRTDTGDYYGTAIHDVEILPTWSHDSRLVALASNHARTAHQIKVVDAITGRLLHTINEVPQYVHSLAFSHDKRYLAIGMVAGILLYDFQENKFLNQQDYAVPLSFRHPGPVITLSFTEDDKQLLSATRHGWSTQPGFRIWDMKTGSAVNELVPTSYAPLIRLDQKQQQICMIDLKQAEVTRFSMNGKVQGNAKRLEKYELQEVSLEKNESSLALNQSLTRLAVGNTEGVVGLWNLENGTRIGEYQDHNDIIRQMIFSPDNRWLAIGVGTHRVRIRDAITGLAVGPIIHNHHRILTLRFSPDSRSLLIMDESGIASTWPLPGPSDHDRTWYEQYAEAYTGTALTQEVPRWLSTDELSQRRQVLAGFPNTALRSKSQRYREQALEYWRRRLDKAALYYLEKWSTSEPDNHQPLLIQTEIYLATSNMKLADQCRKELIKRGNETEVVRLYRRYNIDD
ncbi:MAG: protein kinase [Planctomycetia bacterium]|nr:protein kinase [Planctomycetia bacterium]